MYIMHSIHIDSLPTHFDELAILEKYIQSDRITLSFCYSSNFTNTRIIRRFVELASVKIGMSEEWVNRMILIVDELNNNAIEHGSTDTSQSEMRVTMDKTDIHIQVNIEVEDSWTGPHPKKAKDMELLREKALQKWFKHHNSIRGRGLFLIITKLVDTLYFSDSETWGLIVGIHKKVSL